MKIDWGIRVISSTRYAGNKYLLCEWVDNEGAFYVVFESKAQFDANSILPIHPSTPKANEHD